MSAKRPSLVLLALLLTCLGGCFDLTDEVWWNKEGGARLRRTLRIAATAETAKKKADAIEEAGAFARIDIRTDPRVASFDVRATVEGTDVVVVEDLEVRDAKDLTTVQQRIGKAVKAENATFEWVPAFVFEKLPTGNVKVQASIADVKPPAGFDKEQAAKTFGERVWTLEVHGPSIAMAAPPSAVIGEGKVAWKLPLADIAGGQPKDSELMAEIGPPFPAATAGVLGAIAVVLVIAIVVVLKVRKKAELDAAKPVRPPAPRTMPTVQESGAIPIPVVASEEGLLSDASEINVDPAEPPTPAAAPPPPNPLVNAQAKADAVVKFKCPKCAVELKIPLNLAGKQGKCRKCGGEFVSPVPGQLKQVRAAVAATPITESASLRDAFSVKKIRCSCGMTSAVLKGRAAGEERCPACNQVLVLA